MVRGVAQPGRSDSPRARDPPLRAANNDELTGLVNQRRFDEEFAGFIAHGQRYRRPGALVIIDLNDFKNINDSRGHVAGDRLLAAVGGALAARVRTTDVVARLGGDEFAVILHEVEADTAAQIAEMLVADISSITVEYAEELITVTASAGVAHVSDFDDLYAERLLGRADAAMYVAKGDAEARARRPPAGVRRSRVVAV